MANKPISMSKVRQILKLYAQGIGKKKIAGRLAVSKNTVKVYLELFFKSKVTLDEIIKLSDYELNKLFHPPQEISVSDRFKRLHDYFPEMEKQLCRRGMTIALQYKEYKKMYEDAYSDSQFYMYYSRWCKKVKPSMHIEHKLQIRCMLILPVVLCLT